MTREEIKQGLRKLIDGRWRDGNEFDIILHAIKELEKTDWIPVTERLPDKEGDYFTTKINDFDEPILGMTYYRKGWGWSTSYKIIAWMPLPEPYEEGAEE